jgi:hypothetical protein
MVGVLDLALWLDTPIPHSPPARLRQPLIFNRSLAMKIERFAGHHEAREANPFRLNGVPKDLISG